MRGPTRPTQSLRDEHLMIRKNLGAVSETARKLESMTPTDRRVAMAQLLGYLRHDVERHAAWEESALYPLVDRKGPPPVEPFTATMRYEHKILGRWIDELAREAEESTSDPRVFARRAERILGLIAAHMEVEEEVILPILDGSMTAREFDREVGAFAEYR
jgi:hemerythrin-like domain-containing protein